MRNPCTGKINLLIAFCRKVSELNKATEYYAALALAERDDASIFSARRRCEALKAEAGEIRDWYFRHDVACVACYPPRAETGSHALVAFA